MTAATDRIDARPPAAGVILCADDFAMGEGVTRGIEELAGARRLSATSAIVTGPHWKRHGARLAALRDTIAVGLHLNLTLGAPLGPMPRLAPSRELPTAGKLIGVALSGGLDRVEITEEIERQLDCFEQAAGFVPDHIDGHQHAHVLPGIRGPMIEVLRRRFPARDVLVRDPGDKLAAIVGRRHAGKALMINALAAGFGQAVRAAGFPTNDGFAGVSDFDTRSPYEGDLKTFLRAGGRRPLVMCHPGYPDAELRRVDPIVDRRRQELKALLAFPDLPSHLVQPRRPSRGAPVDWSQHGRAEAAGQPAGR